MDKFFLLNLFLQRVFFPEKQNTKIASYVFIYKSFSRKSNNNTEVPIGPGSSPKCKYISLL